MDMVAANGDTKAVEETNGTAKKEGDDAVKAEEAGEKNKADDTKDEDSEADKRTMEISSSPVKPGAPDANGKVADDVTVEKVEDKVAANGEIKAVEEK